MFVWTGGCQIAFDTLKDKLSSYPILQFPNFDKSFILETDASSQRIAGVLMQLPKGSKVIIGCFSRVCSSAEKKYGMPKLEMLAIVEAVNILDLTSLGDILLF